MNTFEFDKQKSQLNLHKHDIDFLDAQKLWLDPELVEIEANFYTEIRKLAIGLINDKHWSAIFTYRGENIRIISVRRSRKKEVELYEN
ncbi:MAG: BrnT family toxin [Candidatus Marinimicrobia bacterium]|nr:BrnT family toxin [Candidatus Neomarinimicrobiota bacterium]